MNVQPGVLAATLCLALIAACAQDPVQSPPRASAPSESPLPGSIGVAVANKDNDVVVVAVRADSAAAHAHVQPGDRIVRLDGVPVNGAVELERRVLDAKPGTVMRVEFTRGTQTRVLELPVEELLLAVRA